MKKSVDNKSIFALVVLLCFLGLLAAYFLGYKKMEDKANQLVGENNNLRTRIESLKTYYDTEAQNKADILTMSANIDEIYSKYEGDVRQEDGIFEAMEMADASGIVYSSIGFGGNVAIKNISVDTVQAAGLEKYQDAISFRRFDVTYDGVVGYAELKELVNALDGNYYDLAIGSLSFTGNDRAKLQGTSVISFYSVTGIGADYNEPVVTPYSVGTDNLFGFTYIEKEEETVEEVED